VSAQEPPDWVPPMWTRGRLNRRFYRSPGRMLIWFSVVPVAGVVITVTSALSGGWTWVVFAAATLAVARQSAGYWPRAWRAYRRSAVAP
jgi:hypothetical protein